MGLLEDLTAEYAAAQELDRQGSVMAQDQSQHPLGALGQTVHDLMQALNPIDWMGGMGGASQAVIAPTNNKQLQGLYALAREVAPALMRRAERVPRTIHGYMRPGQNFESASGQKAVGSFQNLDDTFRQGQMNIAADQSPFEGVSTLLHELTHFLSGPKVYGRTKIGPRGISATAPKKPEHALETAQQIGAMLPEQQSQIVHKYVKNASDMKLSDLAKTSTGADLRRAGDSRLALDEARSYLVEALLARQEGLGGELADPMLEPIARALGVRLR